MSTKTIAQRAREHAREQGKDAILFGFQPAAKLVEHQRRVEADYIVAAFGDSERSEAAFRAAFMRHQQR